MDTEDTQARPADGPKPAGRLFRLGSLADIAAALEDIADYAAPGSILDPLAGDGQNLATVGAIARDALRRMEGREDV